MLGQFVADNEAARTARRDHIEARTELDSIAAQLSEQISVLDGMTRYRFGSDPEVMAGWQAARHQLGVPRTGVVPPGEVKNAA